MKKINKFTVVRDTKEKVGKWDFDFYRNCEGTIDLKLKEGDYTTKELLDLEIETGRKIFRVERKKTTAELATNFGNKDILRFERELERLVPYEHKYIILEFDELKILDFPKGSGIPERILYRINKYGKQVKNIKITGQRILQVLENLSIKYSIPIIYSMDMMDAKRNFIELVEKIHAENYEV